MLGPGFDSIQKVLTLARFRNGAPSTAGKRNNAAGMTSGSIPLTNLRIPWSECVLVQSAHD
jgi:hypothetical protein